MSDTAGSDCRSDDSVGVLVLWFSKDRPLQLAEAIRTFTRFAELPHNGYVRHVVLYACTTFEQARCYSSLAAALPDVVFVDEMTAPRPSHDSSHPLSHDIPRQSHFSAHLRHIVDLSAASFVLLCVDDVLFVEQFSLSAILPLFASPSLLSYHLALHPGLRFHHPSSTPLTLPTFTSPPSDRPSHSLPSLLFSHSSGTGSHDFRYPFSLVASIYRLADVRLLVRYLLQSATLPCGHPNLLESSGNALIATRASLPAAVQAFLPTPSPSDPSALTVLRPLSGLPSRPVCVVVTVNRVQSVYCNAVFESVDGGVDAMLRRFQAGGWQLDEAKYGEMAQQGHFTSAHVGELLWKHTAAAAVSSS